MRIHVCGELCVDVFQWYFPGYMAFFCVRFGVTAGLTVGDIVLRTQAPLSVELGPGNTLSCQIGYV
jgi:hypothetical protein